MSDYLFNEFNEISSKEWKQKIQVDLKGADYNDTLIWKNIEGIDVKPFYHLDKMVTDGFFIDKDGLCNVPISRIGYFF